MFVQGLHYQPFAEFQGHDAEFDYLRSQEIEERVNDMKWVKRMSHNHLMLTANDKTIKLWRIYKKHVSQVASHTMAPSGPSPLRIPALPKDSSVIAANSRRVRSHRHIIYTYW